MRISGKHMKNLPSKERVLFSKYRNTCFSSEFIWFILSCRVVNRIYNCCILSHFLCHCPCDWDKNDSTFNIIDSAYGFYVTSFFSLVFYDEYKCGWNVILAITGDRSLNIPRRQGDEGVKCIWNDTCCSVLNIWSR